MDVEFCQMLSLWKDYMMFFFHFINVMYCIGFVHILNCTCIPGIDLTWSWWTILLMWWKIGLLYFIQHFYTIFIRILVRSFLIVSFSGFCLWPQKMSLEPFPLFCFFWKSLRRIGINYSLNIWLKSPAKPPGPGLFFIGRFLTANSIALLVISVFRLCISSRISLGTL